MQILRQRYLKIQTNLKQIIDPESKYSSHKVTYTIH